MKISSEHKAPGNKEKAADSKGKQHQQETPKKQAEQAPKQSTFTKEKDKS